MKFIFTLILACFCSVVFAHNGGKDNTKLLIKREGSIIRVLNFKEGDKIKLFEVISGDHILSKTRGEIDLSQLPVGEYLLENNEGKSIVIQNRALQQIMSRTLGTDFVVYQDSQYNKNNSSLNTTEDLENHYIKLEGRLLPITRKGDIITVNEFKEDDKIKLFELKDRIHVISKTSETIDLSQLPVGIYLLENNKGQAVVIEKSKKNHIVGI